MKQTYAEWTLFFQENTEIKIWSNQISKFLIYILTVLINYSYQV